MNSEYLCSEEIQKIFIKDLRSKQYSNIRVIFSSKFQHLNIKFSFAMKPNQNLNIESMSGRDNIHVENSQKPAAPLVNQNNQQKIIKELNLPVLNSGQPLKISPNIESLHQKLSIKPQKNYLKVVNEIIETQRTQCIKDRKVQLINKEPANKQSVPNNPCSCQGNTQCKKKLVFLQDQLRKMNGSKCLKPIIAIYNIEKIIGHVQFYMVEYFDHSLQKLSGAQLKKNYLKEYIRFLQEQCFDS